MRIEFSAGWLVIIGIVFIVLKLCNVIHWSWIWVLLPFIFVFLGLLLVIVFIVFLVSLAFKE